LLIITKATTTEAIIVTIAIVKTTVIHVLKSWLRSVCFVSQTGGKKVFVGVEEVVVLILGIVVEEGHEEDIVEGVIVVVVGVEGVV